jgi:MoaA/NifB/PqqE/SkfB family radical SAM enzyme
VKGYAGVVSATREKDVLFSVLIELTYRCNLDCFFCYNDVSLRGRALSFAQYCQLFEDLAEMEVMHIVLSGGEPLAHPDFLRIGAVARELGFVIRLKSNGHALRGDLLRNVLREIDPFVIEVSLHGASRQVHDRQTRVEGSFDRLLVNLDEMIAEGARVKLNATLTAWNERELEKIFELADSLGLPIQFDPDVTPRDDGDFDPLEIQPSADGLERLLKYRAERVQARSNELPILREGDQGLPAPAGTRYCGAGCSALAVDPFGNVYPCVQWRQPIGNLHKDRIGDIWGESTKLVEIRNLNERVRTEVQRRGEMMRFAAFCPGLAEQQTGSPLKLYPGARQKLEIERLLETEDSG